MTLTEGLKNQVINMVAEIKDARSRQDYEQGDKIRQCLADMGFRVSYRKNNSYVIYGKGVWFSV